MPLINTSLPNLIQGVSQQPDAIRYDGQCEEQENALSSVVEGLQKRPAADFIGSSNLIDTALSDDTFFHLYKRSDSERYCITQDNYTLRIHNADTGVKCTITEDTTSDFSITNNEVDTTGTYLGNNKPKQNFKALTIGDSTFLLNTAVVVSSSTATTSSDLSNSSLIFIKQGDYTKKYGVTINDVEKAITSRPTSYNNNALAANNETSDTATKAHMADTSKILEALLRKLLPTNWIHGTPTNVTIDGITFTPTQTGNLLYLKTTSTASYSITGIDGLAGEGIGVVHREVSSLADLPTIAPHNFKVKIIGDAELNQDDYYVKFISAEDGAANDTVGEGSWVECAGALIKTDIDATKMPRMFVSTAPDVFEIRRMSFDSLKSGDLNSNPYPSFIGTTTKINNIFQYKNRLGFLANDSVIMSEAGFGGYDSTNNIQSYNFFRTTVTDLLDGDPIDVSVSSNDVTNLRSAQPFQENLILFSENAQFVLKGGELLTPKSVSVTAVTNFDTVNTVDPIPLGSYLYFPFQRGDFSGVREFTVNANADIYDANEITAHVPKYIPKDLTSFTGSNTEQLIAITSSTAASSGSETDIFIYKFFFNNQQKGLSSWSKFIVSGAVIGIKFIDSDLYVLQAKNSKTNLLKIPMEAGKADPSGHNTHLDMRVYETVGANTNTIQLPYIPESTDTVQVYTDDGLLLENTISSDTITLDETPTVDTKVYAGIQYDMKYVFSKLVFKAPAGNSKSPSNASDFLIRNGNIFFNNSASFKVKVQPEGREEKINEFTPTVIGTQMPDEFKLSDGAFRFPVFTKANSAKITLQNNTALPCNLQSAEFESFIHSRSNRYG